MPTQPIVLTADDQKARKDTRVLLAILVFLNVADAIISQFIIFNGYGVEGNTFMSHWVNQNHFILIKAGAAILAAILLLDISRRVPKPALVIAFIMVIFCIAIVCWHILKAVISI
jgi:hypothetical protein